MVGVLLVLSSDLERSTLVGTREESTPTYPVLVAFEIQTSHPVSKGNVLRWDGLMLDGNLSFSSLEEH